MRSSSLIKFFAAPLLALMLPGASAIAQDVIDNSEHLDSDRPEAWGMNYFTSITLLSGLSVPRTRALWSLEGGAEFGWIPKQSLGERTIGFDGTKEENLNHSTVFARPRLTVGLPWRTALTLSYVPPLRISGVRPHLFAFALERPLYEGDAITLGARFYGQVGQAKGDFTCSRATAELPLGSRQNPYGCNEASNDKAVQRYLGLEISGAWRLEHLDGLTPWVAIAGNYLDTEAHVRALTFDIPDRSNLDSETWTFSASFGVSYPVTTKINASFGVFYSPLSVKRHANAATDNDALLNGRALISYAFHGFD